MKVYYFFSGNDKSIWKFNKEVILKLTVYKNEACTNFIASTDL
jgi:hypothetical protein